jgi:hypothetical protein
VDIEILVISGLGGREEAREAVAAQGAIYMPAVAAVILGMARLPQVRRLEHLHF